jgi:KaiC/GvpD/RAD55 family RecA-like ATPase
VSTGAATWLDQFRGIGRASDEAPTDDNAPTDDTEQPNDEAPTANDTEQPDDDADEASVLVVLRNSPSWKLGVALAMPLAEALTNEWQDDAHFVAYEPPDPPVRLKSEHLTSGGSSNMHLLILEVDDSIAHTQKIPARPEWRAGETEKIEKLRAAHPGAFVYETRGGYRIVQTLPRGAFKLTCPADAIGWKAFYLASCDYFESRFGIVADRQCCDWTRLQRLPFVVRDGIPQTPQTYGDPNAVGTWTPPSEVLEATARRIDESPPAPAPSKARTPGTALPVSPEARASAVAALVEAWPKKGRHVVQLALTGWLAKNGWHADDALELLCDVCRDAGDEDRTKREQTIRATYAALADGRDVSGAGTLAGIIGDDVNDVVRRALRLDDVEAADRLCAPRGVEGPMTPAVIVAGWRKEGPLTRMSTGIEPLDQMCRGGLPVPWRVNIVGAPSAGKTALAIITVVHMARAGAFVGILAVDEDPDDLTVRLAQMSGFGPGNAERRDPDLLRMLEDKVAQLPIRFYDGSHTIQSAAADLSQWAKAAQKSAVFLVDSLQAASSAGAASVQSAREHVEANVRAIREASTAHRMLVIATSEANRNSYRNDDAAETTNDMAAGAESRAIEFGAQTQLMLRTPKEHADVIHVRVAKNRRGERGEFWLRLDRDEHAVTECLNPALDPATAEHREEQERAKVRGRVQADAEALAAVLAQHPEGLGELELRAAVKAAGHGWGVPRLNAARVALGDRVRETPQGRRRVWSLEADHG